jgi:hypothetical protein
MKHFGFAAFLLLGSLSGMAYASQVAREGSNVSAIVTVYPKSGELATTVPVSAVQAKVGGKTSEITDWQPFRGTKTDLQLLLLIDDSARSSLGLHLKEMEQFLLSQPPTTEVAVAYMQNSGARLTTPFTTDHKAAADTLRLPMGVPGGNGSPYFVLSDVIKKWQRPDGVRREVVMISDGIDRYSGLRFDPNDPYVQNTTKDCIVAGVVVYSIYYHDAGFADRTFAGTNSGQNYLLQMTQATGGQTFYQGFSNPVNMTPFLNDINKRLANQYELALAPPVERKGLQNLKVQVSAPNTKVEAPQQVYLDEGK